MNTDYDKLFASYGATSNEPQIYLDVAKELYGQLENGAFGFDIMVVIAVIGLIKTLIDLYIQCKKNDWHLFSDSGAIKSGSVLAYFKRRRLNKMIAKLNLPEERKVELFAGLLEVGQNRELSKKLFDQRIKETV